ncbi:MAG: fibronectin type III domain-containing protein, partial [Armatimonadetes bacterium]|nr:fibronectin type III domain-containing protein [Armatimonadota bacterium]
MQRSRTGLLAAATGLALALYGSALLAQDSDGDGLSDAVEQKLATDPKVADELVAIAEDPTGEGAEREQYAPGYDLTRVLFGNAGQDRFVWCLEFMEDFLADNAIVILYVDADNDPATGRKQGVEGTDYQLHFSLGGGSCTQYAPDGQTSAGPLPRFAVDGKRLYCTFDVKLKQDTGQSSYRLSVLSEKREPHVGVDSTGWLDARGAGESGREKIMTDDDLTESLHMTMTRGEDLIERLRADPKNVHIPVNECELDRFTMSDDEYREWSARRTGAPAAIRVKAPKGTYRPGIFVRDEGGAEKYALYVGGERKGLAIADDDDNKTKLLFMDEPIAFAGDETLEFRAGQAAGGYRVESVIFLAEKPEVRARKFEIAYLEATQLHAPFLRDPTQVRLTWITSWPAACKIEYGQGDTRNQSLTEPALLANHRVFLRDLKPGQRYSARMVATTPAGQEVVTKPVTFTAGERPKRKGRMPDLVRVPLSVLNATGVALTDWPVETGVALPSGLLTPGEQVRLTDAAGKWLILQTEPRALWPDGSVKWLGLTFLATVGPEERTPLTLELGAQVQVPDSAALPMGRAQGEQITVNTGAATFELPGKEAHQLLAGLTPAGAPGPTCPQLTGLLQDAERVGYRLTVDPARTSLEVNGTVRCVVRLGGKFVSEADPTKHLFDWEARVTAYRGKAFVRVLFTIGNDCPDADFTGIRSISLTAALAGSPTGAQIGGDADAPPLTALVGDTLYQHHDSGWALSSGATGTRAAGWASAMGAGVPLTVAVRDFWQQYPKSLAVRAEGIDIGLLPPLTDDQYAEESRDRVELVKLYYYLQNGLYKLRQGVAKTHELYLIAGMPEDVPLQAFRNPLVACADPEWTRSTGAWGNMPVGDDFWATIYDETMDRGFAAYLKDREDTKAYGMLNFGDWWGERKYNWGNIEYDTQHAFFQHFVRTGDTRYYYAAEQAARHNGDVDTVHFHSDPNRVGGVYTHSLGHTGSYFPAGFVDAGSPTAGFSDSHTWTEGHLEAFLL